MRAIETAYKNNDDPSCVDYVRFCDEIDSVFTLKGLAKNPTAFPAQFNNYIYANGAKPLTPINESQESPELLKVLHRLSGKVEQRRLDVCSYLEDCDFRNEGKQFFLKP